MVAMVEFDLSDFTRYAQALGGAQDQVPYALALALNRSADNTRNLLIQSTWPGHVRQRNASFIAASLTTRESRANKTSLAVEIYDRLDRGNLLMQATGGTRAPHGGSFLAVPSASVAAARTSRGVPARLRPKNMPTAVRIKDQLFAKDKRSGRLRLLYVLKHQTRIPKRVPFFEDFANSMLREMRINFPLALDKAMATRR